jgi:hypothetical protein
VRRRRLELGGALCSVQLRIGVCVHTSSGGGRVASGEGPERVRVDTRVELGPLVDRRRLGTARPSGSLPLQHLLLLNLFLRLARLAVGHVSGVWAVIQMISRVTDRWVGGRAGRAPKLASARTSPPRTTSWPPTNCQQPRMVMLCLTARVCSRVRLTDHSTGPRLRLCSAPGAHVAIQGYVQASAGQAFVLDLTRDAMQIRGLEAFVLMLEVDGVKTELRPEVCGLRGGAPPEWILEGNFSGKPVSSRLSVTSEQGF